MEAHHRLARKSIHKMAVTDSKRPTEAGLIMQPRSVLCLVMSACLRNRRCEGVTLASFFARFFVRLR